MSETITLAALGALLVVLPSSWVYISARKNDVANAAAWTGAMAAGGSFAIATLVGWRFAGILVTILVGLLYVACTSASDVGETVTSRRRTSRSTGGDQERDRAEYR